MYGLSHTFFAAFAVIFNDLATAAPTSIVARTATSAHKHHNGTWIVTSNNTINSTSYHNDDSPVAADAPSTALPISLVNQFEGASVNAYLTGLDGDGAAFFLLADGTAYYPTNPPDGEPPQTITEDVAIPLGSYGETVTVNLPNYVSSGRIYFVAGTLSFAVNYGSNGPEVVAPSFTNSADPNIDANYGFVEFTYAEEGGVYSNLSYVDYVGLTISQLIQDAISGACQVLGLPANAVSTVCSALAQQSASDGQAWSESCQTDGSGNYIRALAPLHLTEIDSSALSGYYDDYIDEVWDYYTDNVLTITGESAGNFTGQVDSTGEMLWEGSFYLAKPVLVDILGCNSGPFSNPSGTDPNYAALAIIVPRFCAAFTRSTLLLPGGNAQPDGVDESQYYTVSPTDHYSRIVHEYETDGKGYAFSYDDVTPENGADASGLCVSSDPESITFTVGT